MSERRISVTINGPEGMLEAMAKTLEQEGYVVHRPPVACFEPTRVEVLEGLMREAIGILHTGVLESREWSEDDDPDPWELFADRVNAWLAKARIAVPDRTPKPPSKRTGEARPVFPKPGSILDTQARAYEQRENERKRGKARKKRAVRR